jgi:hypothetical protein
MNLAVAILAAIGSLCAAVGSGLQAREDLNAYRFLLDELGIPRVAQSVREYVGNFLALMGPAKANQHPIGRANPELQRRIAEGVAAVDDAGRTLGTDWKYVREQARTSTAALALKRKAIYWFLILLGSLALLAAAMVALVANV